MNTAAPEKPRPERPPKLPNRFPQKFDEQSVTLNDKFDDSAWVFVLGVGLDPEVITAGVHAKLGPFFNRNTVSRPNAEFAFLVKLQRLWRSTSKQFTGFRLLDRAAGPCMWEEDQALNFIDRDFEEL